MEQQQQALFAKPHRRPRPIERCLPENIQDIVPDSRLYKQLLQTEKRLDSTILLKKLAIQDALAKPIKLRRTLRIYVSNTTADQLRVTEGGNMEYSAGAPSWTLRIEGRLLDPQNVSTRSKQTHQQQQYTQAATPKFSRFVKHMVVELDRDQTLYPDSNIIEYHALQGQTDFDERDGFEIKRQGDRNVNARIVISMDYGPDRYKMAPELAEVVGHDIGETSKSGLDQLVNKAQIVLTLWQYVKLHKLQDTDDRRVIRCDAQLRKLFNADKVLFPQVPDLVTLWLLPPDPIVINYTIKVDTDNVASRQAYDIEVEMDDLATIQSLQGVTGLSDLNKEIMQLDDQITTAITTLSNHKLKRDFLCAFAADPVRFIDQFVASQSRDLEIMLGDQRVNREEARQSQFYRQVWVKDAVQTFMASKV